MSSSLQVLRFGGLRSNKKRAERPRGFKWLAVVSSAVEDSTSVYIVCRTDLPEEEFQKGQRLSG